LKNFNEKLFHEPHYYFYINSLLINLNSNEYQIVYVDSQFIENISVENSLATNMFTDLIILSLNGKI